MLDRANESLYLRRERYAATPASSSLPTEFERGRSCSFGRPPVYLDAHLCVNRPMFDEEGNRYAVRAVVLPRRKETVTRRGTMLRSRAPGAIPPLWVCHAE
eukprot:1369967-Amorphochlora_amoeboformis.AAC.1